MSQFMSEGQLVDVLRNPASEVEQSDNPGVESGRAYPTTSRCPRLSHIRQTEHAICKVPVGEAINSTELIEVDREVLVPWLRPGVPLKEGLHSNEVHGEKTHISRDYLNLFNFKADPITTITFIAIKCRRFVDSIES